MEEKERTLVDIAISPKLREELTELKWVLRCTSYEKVIWELIGLHRKEGSPVPLPEKLPDIVTPELSEEEAIARMRARDEPNRPGVPASGLDLKDIAAVKKAREELARELAGSQAPTG